MLKKIRTQQITLDLPIEDAEAWVRAVLQTLYKDGDMKTVQTVDRTFSLHRRFTEFVTQFETVQDPVTQQTITASGAGLSLLVSAFVKSWILHDLPQTTLTPDGDILET